MKDIVILAGTAPWSVLSLCKAAKDHGAKTYCICIGLSCPMDYSKSKYVTASYNVDLENLRTFWDDFFKQHRFNEKPVLFAVYDGACLLVDKERNYYESRFDLCLPSSQIVNAFNDKSLAGDWAEANGMTIPKTINVETTSQIDEVCNTFSFPVIVKPTTASEHIKFKFKMKVAENANEFRLFASQLLDDQCHFICQEYIKGEDKDCKFYIFYRNKKGDIVECMGEKTLQSNGIMTIGTTVYDKNLANLCRGFIEKIDYVGIGGIEVKQYNGIYFFIEMSTRTEGFVTIADMAGVSLGKAAYFDKNGMSLPDNRQNDGVKYVDLLLLIINYLNKKRFFRLVSELFTLTLDRKTRFVSHFFGARVLENYHK